MLGSDLSYFIPVSVYAAVRNIARIDNVSYVSLTKRRRYIARSVAYFSENTRFNTVLFQKIRRAASGFYIKAEIVKSSYKP